MARFERIFGSDGVREAVRSGRPIVEIFIAKGSPVAVGELPNVARAEGIPVRIVTERQLMEHSKGGTPEGVVAYVKSEGYSSLEELLGEIESSAKPPVILAVDLMEDAEELGRLARVVEAAGLGGILLPVRAVGITPAVVKAAKGSIERLKVARVPNLPEALSKLAGRGFRILGVDPEGGPLERAEFGPRCVIVLPPESHRLSRIVVPACHALVRPPFTSDRMDPPPSVTAGQVLYEWARRRDAGSERPSPTRN